MNYFRNCLFLISLLIPLSTAQTREIPRPAPGLIWKSATQEYISEKQLLKELRQARHILIGQQENNPQHQKHVAHIIQKMKKSDRKPVVLLSQIERSKQNAFSLFEQRQRDPKKNYDADGLDMLLDWRNSRQTPWETVRPLFDVIIREKIPVQAIRFSRYEMGDLHQKGLAGLPDDLKSRLMPLLGLLPPDHVMSALHREMDTAYCQGLPGEVITKLGEIHQAQEALMAHSIATRPMAQNARSTITLTTADYIHQNSSLRFYLEQLKVKGKITSLLMRKAPQRNGEESPQQNMDFIWYTEGPARPDPCVLIKKP